MAPDLGDIVDGCPPGLYLSEMDLQNDLDRRRPGNSRYTKQRREPDKVHILSGIFEGKITGTPIDLLIDDVNQRLKDHSENMYRFRPGHADFTPIIISMDCVIIELVGVARETAMRECRSAIEKYLMKCYRVTIRGCLSQLGPIPTGQTSLGGSKQQSIFLSRP